MNREDTKNIIKNYKIRGKIKICRDFSGISWSIFQKQWRPQEKEKRQREGEREIWKNYGVVNSTASK